MDNNEGLFTAGFNPTFLFTWKGVRMKDEKRYHAHEHLELAFIMSGHCRYRIDDVIYDVEEGDLLVINPGVYHQALFADEMNPATEFFIGASDFCLDGMEPNHLMLSSMPIYKTGPELKQKLMRLCVSMGAEKDMCRTGRYFMMQSYLVQFMIYLLREEQEPHAEGRKYYFESVNKQEIVSRIIEYIEDHYSEHISLDVISGNMYVSPFYISKSFKSVTGDTPIRYLINVRLDKAAKLLRDNSDMSIREVAEAVGYDDVYHFSKLFKKKFGYSPSKAK